jgi:Leucine-rich repeat (LRR) protein
MKSRWWSLVCATWLALGCACSGEPEEPEPKANSQGAPSTAEPLTPEGAVAELPPSPGRTPAPTQLFVRSAAELENYEGLAKVRELDLALSLVDARTSPLPAGAEIPTGDQCEGLDLARIAEAMPNLTRLRISGCQSAVHSGLQAFAGIRELELADLIFDDLTIARVAELQGLRALTLLRVAATPASTMPIVRKLALEELSLRELERDSLIGDVLGDLSTLRRVRLEGAWTGHRAMLSLGKATQLRSLTLVDTSIGNFSLNQIKGLTELREVHWVGETFTDNSPLYLRELPVEKLYCDCPRVGDGGLKHLRYLPALRELQLERSRTSAAGLDALAKSPLLERVVLGDLELDDRAFVGLSKLDELVELDLAGGVLLEPEIPTLAELRGLRRLNLRVEGLGAESTSSLTALTELRELNLADTAISDDSLKHLSGLTKLESLELRGTRVTNAGLEHLAKLTRLRRLTLDHTDLVDAGVVHLAPLVALEELRLDHTLVTDAAIDTLMKLPKLRRLNLEHTVISRDGADRLRAWGQLERLGLAGTRASADAAQRK